MISGVSPDIYSRILRTQVFLLLQPILKSTQVNRQEKEKNLQSIASSFPAHTLFKTIPGLRAISQEGGKKKK